jgi:PAS domain S-box-containing protein
MQFRLSLSQKGLILIAVPLLFELVFMAWLGYLHNEAEIQASRTEHSKAIVDTMNVIEKDIYDVIASMNNDRASEAAFFGGKFNDIVNDMDHQLHNMRDLVKDDPRQFAVVDTSIAKERETFEVFRRSRELYLNGEMKPRSEARQQMFRDLRRCFHAMLPEDLMYIATEEKAAAREGPERERRNRETSKMVLIVGAGSVVGLAVFLFWLFSRQIVSRLSIISDNNIRLATGQELNPPMRDNDEIADIDRAFHSMSGLLQQATEKERAILQNAQDVIFSLDDRFSFLSASPASTTVFGYTPDELLGSKLVNLVLPEDMGSLLTALKSITDGGTEPQLEMRLKRKDGRMIDIVCSVHWSQKDRTIFCVAHDMTERKQAERLRQEVVQMVSHDLKTPLSAVRTFLELLDAGAFGTLNDRGQHLLKLADSSTMRMLTLIKDLLDIEKMEAGMLELERCSTMVNDLFEQSAHNISAMAAERSVKIESKPCDLSVQVEPARIVQVLVNLLSNAVKFSPNDSVITLSARDTGEWVEVSVADCGRGVPPEKLATIFDRFSQVRISDASEKGGSGLGLAICKALVELHGGTISVKSQEGHGSEFVFTLPKSSNDPTTDDSKSAPAGDPAVI